MSGIAALQRLLERTLQLDASAHSPSVPPPQTNLVTEWVQRMVDRCAVMFNWPIVSLKMDHLAALYRQRRQMLSCGLESYFELHASGQAYVKVAMEAAHPCGTVPVTTPSAQSVVLEHDSSDAKHVKQRGTDPPVSYI